MTNHKNIAVAVGALFLLATTTFIIGDSILIEPVLNTPNFVENIAQSKTQLLLGFFIAFIDGLAIVAISVLMFPILKKQNEAVALGYVALRITEFAIIIAYLISPLIFLATHQDFSNATTSDASYLQGSATALLAERYWGFRLIYLFNGIAGPLFVYLLYQSKLVPRSLCVLGYVGYFVLLIGTLLDCFGMINMNQGFGLFTVVPGALFELVLPIWLFVKGFNFSKLQSSSARKVFE